MSQMPLLLSPLNDMVFKALFGMEEQASKHLLIDFLNSILSLKDADAICEIQHLNPISYREYAGGKESSLDIKVSTGQGERINIEVQLNNVDDFRKRSLYYWSKLYSEGLHESEAYVTLKKSIVINIMDYNLIPETERYHTTYKLYETAERFLLVDDLEIHYVELTKFHPVTDVGLMEATELWLTFLKNAGKEDTEELLNELGRRKEELQMAKEMLGKISADEIMRQRYYAQEKARIDKISSMKYAEIMGMEKGIEKGMEKAKRDTARNLLELGIPAEKIVQATGLSLEDILQLGDKESN
jgi:predicted transposase/invertase (TIGR01784 family)